MSIKKHHIKYKELLLTRDRIKKGDVSITWMGTSGILLSDGARGILIDPYVSRFNLPRFLFRLPLKSNENTIDSWINAHIKAEVDTVIVSHSHFDHSVDAPLFAQKTGAVLTGSESTANIGRGFGLPDDRIKVVSGGDTVKSGKFTITFIESRHGPVFFGVPMPGEITAPLVPPARGQEYRVGRIFSLLIEHPACTIIHHGSAGFVPFMYSNIKADIILLGIAGRKSGAENDREYLRNTAIDCDAKFLVPVHFDYFFRPLDSGISFIPGVRFNDFIETASLYSHLFQIKTLPINKAVTAT